MPVYVQHEVLGKVQDVFNADALWQAPGLALFSRRPLLRDLLERAPREQRGRAATRCFSHVTLVLPQDDVDDDRHLTRGARVRDLAQSLAALHQKDFGDLLGGDEVRYHILGSDGIAPGEVQVKFGHAVYLPAPGEQVQYTVTASRDSAIWQPVCAVYPNQRLTLVGLDAASATFAVPGWPFGPEGGLLLVNDGPDAALELQVRPKDSFECRFDAANGYYVLRGKGASAQRLLLKISRSGAPARALAGAAASAAPSAQVAAPAVTPSAPPQRSPAVWKTRSAAPPASDLTAMPLAAGTPAATPAPAPLAEADATYAPVARHRVTLAALALPRLSRYRETGALALEVGLNAQLLPSAPGKDNVIRFAVDEADELHAITPAGRQRIAVPSQFAPLDNASILLLAVQQQLAERYSALLVLPQGPSQPAAAGTRLTFGRGMPSLAALRVLDTPDFVRQSDGAAASADRLGLSRNAFSWEASGEGLRVARLSPTQALYHLDEQLALVAQIDDATQEQPYIVPPGHHLVAGHYVLRFDA